MTGRPHPRVAIVVLNYNGRRVTEECLLSLQAIDYPDYRVLLIDNGSATDESVPLKSRFGEYVDAIRNEEALGFCRGNNQGLRRALDQGYDYVLLLNNDTTVERDFLTEMVRVMEADPRIGVVGPKIVRHADRSKLDSIGGYVSLWTSRHGHFKRPYDGVRTDLEFVTGCAFLLRRETVEQVGFLDADFYSYWEETDYCLRLRRAGWRVACNPRAVVYHKGGLTNRYLSDLYIYYMIRNGFLCMKKNGRWYQWPSFALLFTLTSVAKYGVYLLATRPREARVVLDAVGDFVRGRFGRKDFAARPAAS